METILDLYRHAVTPFNADKRVSGGGSNPPISRPEGVTQCHAMANFLKRHGVSLEYSAIYHPGLLRTDETMNYIGIKGPRILEKALLECQWGIWEGWQFDRPEIQEAFAKIKENPAYAPPGGESHHQVASRVYSFIEPLLANSRGKQVAIFSSLGPIRAFLCEYFELGYQARFSIGVPNGSIYRVYPDRKRSVAEALEYLDPQGGAWQKGLCPADLQTPINNLPYSI